MSKVEADIRKQQKQRSSAAPKQKKVRASKAPATPSGPLQVMVVDPKNVLVGREPRVDLLPTEVHVDRRERAVARRAWLGVVVVVAIVALGAGGAVLNAARSQSDLVQAQSETTSVLQAQLKYSEVRKIESQMNLIKAGQAVGGSTEIDWATYVAALEVSLPAGVTISDLSVQSSSPLQSFDQSATPLQGTRVATIQISVSSTQIPSVPDWTDALKSLTGYVDSNISSISGDSGQYTASITVHINKKAFDKKYTGKD
jgi:hypothetical protein